ncbi:MAG: class II aldolase/adducin family protein [Paracoccaceae bacterium]|nr:class II aldolase/adducin family protein [Paracoccaceae bacterium]
MTLSPRSNLPVLPAEFAVLSRQIGCDPMLVQGPGGNTSIKIGSTLWVKASGTQLDRAGIDEIFVAVDLDKALAEIDGTGDGSCRAALVDPDTRLRPSIETTFHALLPQRLVFHYHSVHGLCHGIAVEGRRALLKKLDGLDWALVPYARPGIPLTRQIRAACGDRFPEILVLENHGMIVAGECVVSIAETIEALERRLALPSPPNRQSAPPEIPGWVGLGAFARLATDPLSCARATAGSYYPDHVIFLGRALKTVAENDLRTVPDGVGPAVIVRGSGVYMRPEAGLVPKAMLRCLHDVITRIPADWRLRPIGKADEDELLGWDAEKHRQKLAVAE